MQPSTDLADALAEAAHHMNTSRPLPDVMHDLVMAARRSLAGVDHVGVSVTHIGGGIETIAATDDLVVKLDQLQYELDEGPCLAAIRNEDVVVINKAVTDTRWPRFMEQATAMGLRSQMGLRLLADETTVGGLNLYATEAEEIDPEVVHVASLFAEHAALALGRARREEHLKEGMRTRQNIGVAVGVVMERYGLTEERAFGYLASVSQTSNIKLRDVAAEVIEHVGTGVPSGGPKPGPQHRTHA